MNIESISQFVGQYWTIALIISLAFAFFGYYLLRVSLALIGFAGGVYLGQYLWLQIINRYNFQVSSSNEKMIHLGVILIVAFLSTALFISFYKLAIFIVGFVAGGVVAYYIYTWVLLAFNISVKSYPDLIRLGVFVTFGTIVGLVILKSERKAMGTVLATIGSLGASYSIMVPISTYFFKIDPKNLLNDLTNRNHIFMITIFILIFLSLSIISMRLQIGKNKEKNDAKGESKD